MNLFNRNYEYKNFILRLIHRIIFNNIYRIIFFVIILFIGTLLPFNFSYYIWLVGVCGLSIHVILFMIFAWIINPINSLRERKRTNINNIL